MLYQKPEERLQEARTFATRAQKGSANERIGPSTRRQLTLAVDDNKVGRIMPIAICRRSLSASGSRSIHVSATFLARLERSSRVCGEWMLVVKTKRQGPEKKGGWYVARALASETRFEVRMSRLATGESEHLFDVKGYKQRRTEDLREMCALFIQVKIGTVAFESSKCWSRSLTTKRLGTRVP